MSFKYKNITKRIISAAYSVHSHLGAGFQEVIYQRALAYELDQINLEFLREVQQDIYYENLINPIGTRRADFVVEEKVLVEIKALTELEPVHKAQIINYLRVYKLEVGLLINFGFKSMKFHRFVM